MMNYFQNIRKTALEALFTSWDIALRRYPGFVYENKIYPNEIPVFLFHNEAPKVLELKFRFLSKNRYKTLAMEEYYKIITGQDPIIPKSILITIDDGDISLWNTIYPLLKKYNLKATAFIIPGLMDGRKDIISWEQANIMFKEGIIDFQSHTYSHKLIPISPKVTEFITPYLIERYPSCELSQHGDIKLGMPLYKSKSRMSVFKRYIIDNELIDACVKFVESNGGNEFFKKTDWRKRLKSFYNNYRNSHSLAERYETYKEQREGILLELSKSKELIEEKMPGNKVIHLSLPWNVTSNITTQSVKETGYRSIFLGKVNNKYYSKHLPDPYHIPRVSSNFLLMLPGEGRETLISIILKKTRRRSKTVAPYLTH